MGLFLSNAQNKGYRNGASNVGDSLTANQRNLKNLLTKIWNNQDNLRDEDIKTLEYLTKK
jgi:hypothetical protein